MATMRGHRRRAMVLRPTRGPSLERRSTQRGGILREVRFALSLPLPATSMLTGRTGRVKSSKWCRTRTRRLAGRLCAMLYTTPLARVRQDSVTVARWAFYRSDCKSGVCGLVELIFRNLIHDYTIYIIHMCTGCVRSIDCAVICTAGELPPIASSHTLHHSDAPQSQYAPTFAGCVPVRPSTNAENDAKALYLPSRPARTCTALPSSPSARPYPCAPTPPAAGPPPPHRRPTRSSVSPSRS